MHYSQAPPHNKHTHTHTHATNTTATHAHICAQTEGAALEDGRSPSVWDVYVKSGGKVRDGSTADVACDHYHRYKEDIALMKSLGVKNYRFSISWSRLIPSGRKGGAVNPQGAKFYSDLIDEMLKQGVAPAATLYHWDLPQANQDAYKVRWRRWL